MRGTNGQEIVSKARSNEPESSDEDLALIYDAQCPVCTAYSGVVEVEQAEARSVRRIDARSDHPLVREARAKGIDLDDGMVVVHKGQLYHGAEALNLMARLAPRHGLGNRLNRLLFSNPRFARLSYPVLRGGRNTLLKLLGRKKIAEIDSR
jgi:predicted DCC family thiol-disulfide oxidoreductase YuxK